MRIIYSLLALFISTPSFAAPNYISQCQSHSSELTEALILQIQDLITYDLKSELVDAFYTQNITVAESDIEIKSYTTEQYAITYQIEVRAPTMTYYFNAIVNTPHGLEVIVTKATDDTQANAIGQILTPPNNVECIGTVEIKNEYSLVNSITGWEIKKMELDNYSYNQETGLYSVDVSMSIPL